MLTRRQMLKRTLAGSSLLALGGLVPRFVASAAQAARPGDDTVLVVLEMAGGNDGLNTVIPYGDDLYYKARPTLARRAGSLVRVNDHIGLHDALSGLGPLLENGQLAIVQGVGYPNPNRSHFESMDVWHSADPRNRTGNGWLGRGLSLVKVRSGHIPAFHIGSGTLPLALTGSGTAVPSFNTSKPFGLDLGGEFYGHNPDESSSEYGDIVVESTAAEEAVEAATDEPAVEAPAAPTPSFLARKALVREMAEVGGGDGLLKFVQRTSLDAYSTIDRLQAILSEDFELPAGEYGLRNGQWREQRRGLMYELTLIARMVQAGFGTRVFYLSLDGFDTHGDQAEDHTKLLAELGAAVSHFFSELEQSGDAGRVVLMTFSEFGRRVEENASRGTDHGAGSCLFVAGPAVRGGLVGEHPSLDPDRLDSGDLQWHTDFRRVYATLLDGWLGCDSRRVLDGTFEPLPLLDKTS